ncbi:hypothetical protein [Nocardioides panaciterrulae]|uniref:Uncharacterized protein n=1 Tax=Nocardioides panaciterrulae TaxID=661492 RepID=A0A7Y9E3G4_9ACTN|nr:hypothetical protein [Nocardioides panaciterrulae]NYD40533.1 hypothetical protein [Nocardioides panaciterrulae]
MLLETDPAGGAARLDAAGVAALLGAARGEPAAPEATVALASGRLDAELALLGDPLVALELVVAGGSVRLAHRGWVGPELAVLLAGVHAEGGGQEGGQEGEWRLLSMPPAFLTAGLVRLTRIRPRRDVGEPLAGAWHDDLVAAEESARRAALDGLGADFAWRLRATWPGGERLLHAVDGAHGLHLADASGRLGRVSNTFGYRVLSTLLPTDAELDAAPASGPGQ